MMIDFQIRNALPADTEEIARIYNPFIRDSVITFEEELVSATELAARMLRIQSKGYPYLVAEHENIVIGYAYASQWRERIAYRFTVESTIYLDPAYAGKGIGVQLYDALLKEIRLRQYHAVIGVITLPNPASVALHEKLGFVKAAHFSEVGYKFGRWLDVGYWELKL